MVLSMASRQPDTSAQRHSDAAIPCGDSRERPTILVVDDERSIAELLASVLEDAGYRVLTAASGQTGLTIARVIHLDLVLTDYTLPELNGMQLADALRRNPATRHLPVVLMSATRPSSDKLRGVPFLAKPFDLEHVLQVVARHVRAPSSKVTS